MNAILGKVGRTASEEVVLQLVYSKCMPILIYGCEAIYLSKADKASLDFTMTRFLMKLFNSCNSVIINDCKNFFGFQYPTELIEKRTAKFIDRLICCSNYVYSFAIGKLLDS